DLVLSDEDHAAFLEMIESETVRLSQIADQILIAGQLDAGAIDVELRECDAALIVARDRKSTRLNSSHVSNSYAVFCLKKKKNKSPWRIKSVTGVRNPALKVSPGRGCSAVTAGRLLRPFHSHRTTTKQPRESASTSLRP